MAVVFRESTTILNHLQPSLTLYHIHRQSVVSYIEEILNMCLRESFQIRLILSLIWTINFYLNKQFNA